MELNDVISLMEIEFIWPYGGKEVYVAGTFNDWNKIKMFPQTYPPNLYSVKVDLLPGKYEYKFVVDGVWCYDSMKPLVNDTFNGKNNYLNIENEKIVNLVHVGNNTFDVAIPKGDIVVHSGNCIKSGTNLELEKINNWFKQLPHEHKLLYLNPTDIANMEDHFDLYSAKRFLPNVTVLNSTQVNIMGMNICNFKPNDLLNQKKYDFNKCDVLVTEKFPVKDNLNIDQSSEIYKMIEQLKPKIHLHGETFYVDDYDKFLKMNKVINWDFSLANGKDKKKKVNWSDQKKTFSVGPTSIIKIKMCN